MFIRLICSLAIALLLIILPLSAGCSTPSKVSVSLTERLEDIPQVQQLSYAGSADTLKVAIAGVVSPGTTLKTYQELLTYLEGKIGKKILLIQRSTYAEINDLIKTENVDIAFVCSLAYVLGNRDFGMELLAAPQVSRETVYYSYLIVPRNSAAESLEDMRGTVFAFTDPLSNTGRLAPSYQLLGLTGETPDTFFKGYVFTYSHDNSILAVADGLVDGAAVDSLVYDRVSKSSPDLTSKIKVIERWGPYGIPPVVVNPDMELHLKEQLRDAFLNLGVSKEGQRILNDLGMEKFVQVDDNIYDSIRQMLAQVGW